MASACVVLYGLAVPMCALGYVTMPVHFPRSRGSSWTYRYACVRVSARAGSACTYSAHARTHSCIVVRVSPFQCAAFLLGPS
eukprot:7530261-Pyramimonas_sp.AAC.1